MPLNKETLKIDIKTLLTEMLTRDQTSIDEFATRLSNAVDVYVKSGLVTGTCPNNGGPLTNGKVT